MESKPTQVDTENSITLNDLVVLRNIVHIASRRGAFSAEEFSDIGTVYNKVDKFLKKNIKEDSSEKSTQESSGDMSGDVSAEASDQAKMEI
jgi:hypothetical protein